MTTIRPFILTLCLAAAGCGQPGSSAAERVSVAPAAPAASPADSQRRAQRPRIVFLGDSLTAGYGLEESQAVPTLVQARLTAAGYDYEVVNAGVSGDTSAGGLSRLTGRSKATCACSWWSSAQTMDFAGCRCPS